MTETSANGAFTFWTLAEESSRDRLLAGLTEIGIPDDMPAQREPLTIVKAAMEKFYMGTKGGETRLVRPIKHGYSVVTEVRGEDANTYETVVTVKAGASGLEISPDGGDIATHLRAEIGRQYHIATNAQVAHMMAAIIERLPLGRRMRSTGGVYWIGEQHREFVNKLAGVVQSAADGNNVYVVRTIMDNDCIRAVRDRLIQDVTVAMAKINEEVASGDLGKRGLENRAQICVETVANLSEFETLFAERLDDLRQLVDGTKESAARAALLAKVKQEIAA